MSSRAVLDTLAVVLPRYGASLGGGAETLVRALMLRLLPDNDVPRAVAAKHVEVWTTCARDHRTWENYYKPGEYREDGVIVRRFPVNERNLEVFIAAELAMQQGAPLTLEQQLDWLAQSVNSRELYAHIDRFGGDCDALFFAPYLFATTFWGSLVHPERSVVFPCLHNEAYAYLDVFHHLFRSVRGLFFNAPAELELAAGLYDVPGLREKSAVIGMGFAPAPETAAKTGDAPYLLYSGRKETGKNLDLLIDYFAKYRQAYPEARSKLYLIGSGEVDFLKELPAGVIDLGFVSEEEKLSLMAGALALCQPSVNESFSIVIMEAWLHGTPVLVHEECPVTRQHVVESGGGLYFRDAGDFAAVVNELEQDRGLQRKLGQAGADYVRRVYCWPAVEERLAQGLLKLGLARAAE